MSTVAKASFFSLTPERVLEAVERGGHATRPVCYALNSFENRVYEVELADKSRVVAKFYRPGRWSAAQILEEHSMVNELETGELPVATISPFADGTTLHEIDGIFYCLSPRRGGRAPDELDDALALRLGMFVGRMHAFAASRPFEYRPSLDADTYVRQEVAWMVAEKIIPGAFESRYRKAAERIADLADQRSVGVATQRLHADLHLGNVLLRDGELRVLDFDDAATGPPVQDLWLALPGRDESSTRRRHIFLDGYEKFREFDWSTLDLIETLRGLRMVRYCAWLARRADDPAFKVGWPDFGSEDYWRTTTADLEEQLSFAETKSYIRPTKESAGASLAIDDGDHAELTNKDYFWDWEG